MSFKKIQFNFTPPPTVISAGVIVPGIISESSSSSTSFGSTSAANSNAAKLVTRLSNLSDTSAYLQSVIQSLASALGVTFDLSANPELGRALSRIYNTNTPPSSMDMTMYASLLEADINFTRFDLLNPITSSIQISPIQRADISLASKSFENALVSTGTFNQTLPVLLRSLQADQLIFDQWITAINKYPILSVPQLTPSQLVSSPSSDLSNRPLNGSVIDVGTDLNDTLNTALDSWQSSYAGIYIVAASPDPIEVALPSVVTTLSDQPISDLVRLSTTLSNLIGFIQQPQLQQSHDSADNLIVPRLLSDVGLHATNLDFINQVAAGPSSSFTGSLGVLLNQLAPINPGQILNPGLTGLISSQSGGVSVPVTSLAQQAILDAIPEGLKIFAANAKWSANESMRQGDFVGQSIQRLSQRKVLNQGNQTELLSSLKSLSSTISLIQSLLGASKQPLSSLGNNISLNTNVALPSLGLQSFSTLIGSLTSQSGSTFAVDGSTLVITPPSIPVASDTVQGVLEEGGVDQFTARSLQIPISLEVT